MFFQTADRPKCLKTHYHQQYSRLHSHRSDIARNTHCLWGQLFQFTIKWVWALHKKNHEPFGTYYEVINIILTCRVLLRLHKVPRRHTCVHVTMSAAVIFHFCGMCTYIARTPRCWYSVNVY